MKRTSALSHPLQVLHLLLQVFLPFVLKTLGSDVIEMVSVGVILVSLIARHGQTQQPEKPGSWTEPAIPQRRLDVVRLRGPGEHVVRVGVWVGLWRMILNAQKVRPRQRKVTKDEPTQRQRGREKQLREGWGGLVEHCLAQAVVHHVRDKPLTYKLELGRQDIGQHSGGLVGRVTVCLGGQHGFLLVLLSPGSGFLEPVNSIPKPSCGRGQVVRVVNVHGVANALPKHAHCAALDIGGAAPFVLVDEANRLSGEQGQRVHHILGQDGARLAILTVDVIGTRNGCLRSGRGGVVRGELADEHNGVCVAFERKLWVGELLRFGQSFGNCRDAIGLIIWLVQLNCIKEH